MNQSINVLGWLLTWLVLAFAPASASAQASTTPPTGVTRVTTVEGITEYRLANGLRVILFPDSSRPTATVNITYLVGSRHENYGETGMAHLLEHLLFKGSKRFPNPDKDFEAGGFHVNGTTWLDRTNYYLSFTASDEKLRWALAWTADAMVNSFIARKDLDSEMSVVRNEFEIAENDPGSVMQKRMQSLLFDWHNYGNATIGARSDIENVRIENLQAFYRRYYQPDNAVLTVAGRFDEAKALRWVVAAFGRIPRPVRSLIPQWTVEPTADGERQFVVRRKGEVQIVAVGYRTPSGLHPDAEALEMASQVLGDTPNGRLYHALVKPGLASHVFAYNVDAREPGFAVFGAIVGKGESIERVRERLIEVVEDDFAREPVTASELARVVDEARTAHERALADPEDFAILLSEYIALGDWRLFFLAREQLERIRPEQLDAAVGRYFVRDNRVLGSFIPDDSPRRAVVPVAPAPAERLAGFRANEKGDSGEAFDSSYENLDRRTRIETIGDLKLALLPKRNRGQTVNVAISFRWGDERSLSSRGLSGSLAVAMLSRGTRQLSRQQIADEIIRLKMRGGLTQFETTREKLPEALRLVAHIYHEASFPPAEFDELRRQTLTALQAQLDSPEDLSADALLTHFNTYPPGDPRHYTPLDERIAQLRSVSLDDVLAYRRELIGTARGEIAIVGDFDEAPVVDEIRRLFASQPSPSAYGRVERAYREVPAARMVIDTPDKESAIIRARIDLPLRDDDEDMPALLLANHVFGGSGGLTNRLMDRLRQKDGLSYSVGSSLSLGSRQRLSTWTLAAMVAPQNAARAEKAIFEELQRARRDGFTAEEIAQAKKSIVDARAIARADDSTVASRWTSLLDLGRTWELAREREARLLATRPEQVNAAFRKYIDSDRLTVVIAADPGKRQAD
ncbi:pitrilysin family protein [Accumulibacter sp.]|uniref:M16 family metallopeptidase n=1 Tax=Accumulibacter sp. TaxID=2053492 RepID=UPI0025EAA069|nr:pitrilysin family protein [Accumulibacter sp.]MCM8594792.1 insulinase family protein [Accumulibacter sp.]MCM8625103.1 insulinase family protein [Accumulibacter sp.]MDS4048937.1 pitrilysin family protein [Accumulibacter sp.]